MPRKLRFTINITPLWWGDTKDNLELFVLALAWCVDNVPNVASVKASRLTLEVEAMVNPEQPVEMLGLAALQCRLITGLADMAEYREPGTAIRNLVKAGHVKDSIKTILADRTRW